MPDECDILVHNVLLRLDGIIYDSITGKYSFDKQLTSNSAAPNRERFFLGSACQAMLKRSLSMPKINTEEEKGSSEVSSTAGDNKRRNQQTQSKLKQLNIRSKSEERPNKVVSYFLNN